MTVARAASGFLLTLLAGCDGGPSADRAPAPIDQPPSASVHETARLSRGEVIAIAQQVAREAGIDLSTFEEPRASFEPAGREPTWEVSFQMKQPARPGGHFDVYVGDRTKTARMMGGE